MMSLQMEATYEDGVLKFDEPLPFKEHERGVVTIQPQASRLGRATDSSAGRAILRCCGAAPDCRRR